MKKRHSEFFIDVSKPIAKIGERIFCQKRFFNFRFRQSGHYSGFQADKAAIKVSVYVLLRSAAFFREVCIH